MERALAAALLFALPLTLLSAILSGPLVRLLFMGFAPEQLDLAVKLTRINLIGMIFNMLILMLAAAGRASGRFVTVEIIPASVAMAAILGIAVIVPDRGVEGATWILSARAIASFLLLWAVLGCPRLRNPVDSRFAAAARGTFALMGGSSFYKLGPVVDRFWGSQAPSGQLSLYNLAQSGMGAIATLLERAFALPVAPQMSRELHAGNYPLARRIYRNAMIRIWLAVALCGIAGAIAAPAIRPVAAALLNLTGDQISFLVGLGFALLGFLGVAAGGAVVNSAFYSMGDVKTPISVGMLGFVFGLAVKTIAFLSDGLVAMALGTSAYYIVTMIVMITLLERRLDKREAA